MTEADLLRTELSTPLIAVVCAIPLFGEAMLATFDFADVRTFSNATPDLPGLIRALRPSAVIVDNATLAEELLPVARDDMPVVHVGVRTAGVWITCGAGRWEHAAGDGHATPEAVRNVVVEALFARRAAV